jgi:hypothetical protein
MLLLLVAGAQAQEPVDLEEVMCAVCHFEQADQFAQSVHYQQGLILCNDCHGGLPFEADQEAAKAKETGFIGRPGRGQIAEVCAKCHQASAQAFARGPHRDWEKEGNPTCITCHDNHRVLDATLALMEEACADCHESGSAALVTGHQVRGLIEKQQERIAAMDGRADSLAKLARSLAKVRVHVEMARGTLREAEPATHALDARLIEEKTRAAEGEVEEAEKKVEEYYRGQALRRRVVAGLWVFVLVNVALLWWKRRQLE